MAGGGSRYRFELTRLEVAGVIVSSAASLFIVFLLGVYAGGGLGAGRLADEERVVRLPAATTQDETQEQAEPALDDMLGKEHADDDGEDHQVAAADAAPLAVAPVPDRAAGAVVAAGEHAASAPASGEAGDGAAASHPATGADAGAGPPPAPAVSSARPPEARVAVALAPSMAANPPTQRGPWSVQVTATLDPRTADEMLKRLRAKGYDAYVVKAPRQGKTYYRVRVGRFPSAEHANQMVARLRREPGVPEAFVASD